MQITVGSKISKHCPFKAIGGRSLERVQRPGADLRNQSYYRGIQKRAAAKYTPTHVRLGEGGVRLLLKVRIIHKKFFVSSQPDLTTGFNVKTI